MKLALLNTLIVTSDGSYDLKTISVADVGNVIAKNGGVENLDSAIGHESTAQILTELLGVEILVNRQQFSQEVGQNALVFKLNGRAPAGQILSREEIEKIGYSFKLLTRTA